jgi:hypothetical protein
VIQQSKEPCKRPISLYAASRAKCGTAKDRISAFMFWVSCERKSCRPAAAIPNYRLRASVQKPPALDQ